MAQWADFISILALGLAAVCAIQLGRLKSFTGYRPTSWKWKRSIRASYTPQQMPEKNPDNLSDDILAKIREFSGFANYLRESQSRDWWGLDDWNFQDTGVLRHHESWGGAYRTIEIRHNKLIVGSIQVIRPQLSNNEEVFISLGLIDARRFSGDRIFALARRIAYIVKPDGTDLTATENMIYRRMVLTMWRVGSDDEDHYGGKRLNWSIGFDFHGTVDHWLECKERYEQIKFKWSPPLETLHHSP